MIQAHELPEPRDGRNPVPTRVEFQLRRINRIASALFGLRETLGEHPSIRVAVQPDSDYVQVEFAVTSPGERSVAEGLVARLGWDPEPTSRRSGLSRVFYWHGMADGFRACVSWVERPASVDTQGRADLPAGVGVGDQAADAEHLATVDGRGMTDAQVEALPDGTAVLGGVFTVPERSAKRPTVPAMHADLQRLGYEL